MWAVLLIIITRSVCRVIERMRENVTVPFSHFGDCTAVWILKCALYSTAVAHIRERRLYSRRIDMIIVALICCEIDDSSRGGKEWRRRQERI